MRKKYILLSFIIYFLLITNVTASAKVEVTLNKCVDGDTAWFNMNDEKIKARFLAIDTPESTNQIEEYGKEASQYVCNLLMNASKIELEYDDTSDKQDKYHRHLVWVFIDDKLLQELIVKNGFAEVKYIYGDYKYLDQVNEALEYAKENKLNLWNNNKVYDINYIIVTIGIIIIILIFIFSEKGRKKIIKQSKSEIKKILKKLSNNLK